MPAIGGRWPVACSAASPILDTGRGGTKAIVAEQHGTTGLVAGLASRLKNMGRHGAWYQRIGLGFASRYTFLLWLGRAVPSQRTIDNVQRWPDIQRSSAYHRMGLQESLEEDPYSGQGHLRALQFDTSIETRLAMRSR